jgi:transcriptional regulator with XRE-family HTH domain
VSAKFLGQIERGAANPSLDVLDRIARALEVELWNLLKFEESKPKGPAGRAAAAMLGAEKISEYLFDRPPDELERALRILEAALGHTPSVR